ncbi:MAG: hypothetical protein EOM68_18265, partial [Spirochaetia bacterium]|nr:hypothetical protein [Spirochaetia bacterium]
MIEQSDLWIVANGDLSREVTRFLTGIRAGLKNYLSTINPKVGIANALQVVRSGKGAKRDKAVKQLRYYTAMDRQGVTPDDFMLDRIPVLPPRFRRVTESGGMMMIPDANYLYKAMKDTTDDYVQAKEAGLPPDALAAGRLGVYDAFKAITGLGDPTMKALQEKEVGGLLKWVFGKGSPKFGGFQRSVVGGKLDVSGRAVIDIDPSLRLDEVGLPEGQAWGLYRDFTIRKLAQAGMPVLQATKEVVNKSARAKEMMKRVMNERPLIMTRAPALHKFSVVALKPKLIEGHTLMLNPVIEGPLNADVDGNCCDFDTEIILQSALNNPVFEAIVSSMEKRGMKKTLTGDTEMLTSKSMVMIREKGKRAIYVGPIGEVPRIGDPIKDKNGADVYRFPDGVKILSFSDKDASFGWHDVTSLTVESDSEAVEVEIGNETVIVSPNESLAVFDRLEGGLKKARPVESIGAFVPKMKQSSLPFGKEGNFDMGWLHGSFIGDGWLSGNYVGFTKMEERKRARFIEVLEKVIGRKPNWREYAGKAGDNKYADSVKVHFNDPGVVAHFNDYNFYNWDSAVGNDEDGRTGERSALHKQVPPEMIINGTEEYLWGVLSGLIDTDGSICKNTSLKNPRYYASLSTCSPFLADTMQDLCFRLGLRCGKTTSVHKKGGKRKVESVEYTLHLSSVDAYYHLDKIRCVGDREESLINEWKHHTEPVEQKDIIPLSINERKTIRELFPPRIKENLSLYSAVGKDAVMRTTLMLRLSQLEEEASLASLVARIRNTSTVWERVKKVTAVERRDVFDFCVPETKVFVVNRGLVIWDTMTYYVPVSKKAVKDAYDKMMPSKNLLSARNFTAHYLPQEEYILGAYLSTRKGTGPVKRTFKTEQEA